MIIGGGLEDNQVSFRIGIDAAGIGIDATGIGIDTTGIDVDTIGIGADTIGIGVDAVQFHDNLAKDWDLKYQKASFRERIKAFLSLLDGDDLDRQEWLDAGCGTGILARALADRGCSVTGVDASSRMIQEARGLKCDQDRALADGPVFEVVDTIERLGFDQSSFDGIVCSSVLEYLKDPNKTIAQFYRILKSGGVLLVSVPDRTSILRNMQKLAYAALKWPTYLAFSKHSYTYRTFSRLLHDNGFTVTSSVRFGPYLPNMISRVGFFSSLIIFRATKEGPTSPLH
jgi:2-polyprenyl-6-hydroxyphenyl methylase/3-demethylubiquinone-9 3-methyltransferase